MINKFWKFEEIDSHEIEKQKTRVSLVKKSLSFINLTSNRTDFEIGFATGGWKETAELKCNSVGLNLNDYIFKSSNDHYDRGKIIDFVIKKALEKHNVKEFESITYFGDGLWDFTTTQTLGIDFIGVDFKNNTRLINIGAEKVIEDYTEPEKILNWINEKTPGNKVYKT